jgi:hypothetical protein
LNPVEVLTGAIVVDRLIHSIRRVMSCLSAVMLDTLEHTEKVHTLKTWSQVWCSIRASTAMTTSSEP